MIKVKHTHEFWTYKKKRNSTEIDIDISKFIEFLELNGFRNFENASERQLVYIDNNVLKKIEPFQLNSLIREYLKALPEQLSEGVTRNNLIEIFHRKLTILIQKDQINTLQVLIPNFKKDTQTQSFKFFRNCFVEITKDSIKMHDYRELDGFIWEDQKINRDLTLINDTGHLQRSEFYSFLFNCMNQNEGRLVSIISIIGYLMHIYKDSSNAKAVIFCDENISDEANGGSGKSLTVYGISQFVKTAREDGKTFNSRSSFAFQQIEHFTELFFIDDASQSFDFELYFRL